VPVFFDWGRSTCQEVDACELSSVATFSLQRLDLQDPPPMPVIFEISSKLLAPLAIASIKTWSLIPLQMHPGFIRAISSFSVIIRNSCLLGGERNYRW